MGNFARVLRILYQCYLIFVFSIPLFLLYPAFRYFLGKEDFGTVYRMNRWIARYFSIFSFIPLRVDRRGTLPDPPYIICSNHSSYLDILYLMLPFPQRFVFLGKGEILRWPYFRMFFQGMNIPVPRRDHRKAHEAFVKAGEELEKGIPLAIFPEGTIPPNAPQMGNFKNGAFKLAEARQVPIVPVTFLDHWKIFPVPEEETFWGNIRPGRSRVIVHPPVYPQDGDHQRSRELVRERIQAGLDEGN